MAHTAQCSSYPRCRALCRRRQQVDPPRRAQSRQVHRGHHHPTPLSRTAGNRNLINMIFLPSRHSSVGRASAWSLAVSGGTIGPGFESHQYLLAGTWKRRSWLPCWPPRGQQVSHRGESERMCNTYMPQLSVNKAAHSGFETQRRHHQKSNTGYQWLDQNGMASKKFKTNKNKNAILYS